MKKIVVINGYPQSGKDTFVNFVKEILSSDAIPVFNISSIERIWQFCIDSGIPMHEKTPAQRKLAAAIKSAFEEYDFFETKQTMEKAFRKLSESNLGVAFLHMREPMAIAQAKLLCPEDTQFITVFIDRADANRKMGNAVDEGVERYVYDFIVDNDEGIEKLYDCAKLFSRRLV